MSDESLSCVEPVESDQVPVAETDTEKGRESMATARVGKEAPGFTAQAYIAGAFEPVSLSDFAGKWVVLCFYPGDFTFV